MGLQVQQLLQQQCTLTLHVETSKAGNVLVYENNKYLIEILSEDKVKRLRC